MIQIPYVKKIVRKIRSIITRILEDLKCVLEAQQLRDDTIKLKNELTTLLENFEKSVPMALRACARSSKAANSDLEIVDILLQRIEYVRAELLLANGSVAELCKAQKSRPPVILAQQKFATMSAKRNIRCNICCGSGVLPDYLNVWNWPAPGVDIVAEAGNLPFIASEVAEIRIQHMDACFPSTFLATLLPYWGSLLGSGGLLRCVVTDTVSAQALLAEAGYTVLDTAEAGSCVNGEPLREIVARHG